MYKEIPKLVSQWMECVYESGKTDRYGMARRLKDIGEMPKQLRDRAFWTASLLNPLPALDVCMEIRPAMLACRNDYDRINLAWAGLHSSIDSLLRAKGCFDQTNIIDELIQKVVYGDKSHRRKNKIPE